MLAVVEPALPPVFRVILGTFAAFLGTRALGAFLGAALDMAANLAAFFRAVLPDIVEAGNSFNLA